MLGTLRTYIYALAVFALLASFALLYTLPIQLMPNLKSAKLTVESYWPNASSSEMVSEVLSPIAQSLLQLKSVKDVVSFGGPGYGYTELVFASAEEATQARQEVNALLGGLTGLPADAKAPYISDGSEADATGWVLFSSTNSAISASDELDYVERHLLPQIRKIDGINNAYILNKPSLQKLLMVDIDFAILRRLELSVFDVAERLSTVGNLSLGEFVHSHKTMALRLNNSKTIEEMGNLLFTIDETRGAVRLADFAEIKLAVPDKVNMAYYNGMDVVPIVFYIRDDADLFAVYKQLNKLQNNFNSGVLAQSNFRIDTFGDPTPIIDKTRNQLLMSMFIGIIFTVLCVLAFYRNVKSSIDILLFIPFTFLSILLTYWIFNVPLNIISVTGVAIATGVILDPAIIITEHFRQKRDNKISNDDEKNKISRSLLQCIALASLTSVLVFLPILTLDSSEAKIFSDLGISFICAIIFSTILPLLILPALQGNAHGADSYQNSAGKIMQKFVYSIDRLNRFFKGRWIVSSIAMITFIGAVYFLFPAVEYLPQVSNNTSTVYFRFPQSTPADDIKKLYVDNINKNLQQFDAGENENEVFLRTWAGGGYGFFRHAQNRPVDDYLDPIGTELKANMTDFRSAVRKTNLMSNYGGDKSITVDIIGANVSVLEKFVADFIHYIETKNSELYVTTSPDLNSEYEAVNLRINEIELLRLNIEESELLGVISSSCAGVYVRDVIIETIRYGLYIRPEKCHSSDEILNTLVANREGEFYFVGDVVEQEKTTLPQDLMLKNNLRAFRVTANLGSDDESSRVLAMLKDGLEELVKGYKRQVSYELAEDSKKIDLLLNKWSFVFVIVIAINILLVGFLCRSATSGLMMMIGYIPAIFGAIGLFSLMSLVMKMSFDVITLLGGVLMIGIVSNGFIILAQGFVSEARNTNADLHLAMATSVSNRLRPIILTTLSTVSAMLPLLVSADDTAVLYRGLAAVLIGGVVLGSLVSVTLLPSLTVSIYKRFK